MKKNDVYIEILEEVFNSSEKEGLDLEEIRTAANKIAEKRQLGWEINKNTMRRILQENSSDAKRYNGKNDIFKCVYGVKEKEGVWALRKLFDNSSDNKLPDELFDELDNLLSKQHDQVSLIKNIKNTIKTYEVKIRTVQQEFRSQLIDKYKYCPLTHINESSLLIASHIKPWSESSNEERLDVNNGILLSVHLDKLFDHGNISFDDNGDLICKKNIIEIIKGNFFFKKYNIKVGDEMRNGINDSMKEYLSFHRKKFQFNEENSVLFSTVS